MSVNLKISKYTQVIPTKNGQFFIFNSRYGNLVRINGKSFAQLSNFVKTGNVSHIDAKLLDDFTKRGFILSQNINEDRLYLENSHKLAEGLKDGKSWNFLRLTITEDCNLKCNYCYFIKQTRKTKKYMPFDIAQTALSKFYNNIEKHNILNPIIWFFGGEPFLNIGLLKRATSKIKEYNTKLKKNPEIAFITNGTIYPTKLIQNMKQLNTAINISLDGAEPFYNSNRIYSNGVNSFYSIDRNIKRFVKDNFKIRINCVVTRNNIDGIIDLIDYCHDKGINFINIDSVSLGSNLQADTDKLIDILLEAMERATKRNIMLTGFWRDIAEQMETPTSVKFCQGAGNEIDVQPNGKIKLCSAFKNTVGHISQLEEFYSHPEVIKISKRSVGNLGPCDGCVIEGMCKGGCVAEVYNENKTLNTKPSECEFFQKMTMAYINKYYYPEYA